MAFDQDKLNSSFNSIVETMEEILEVHPPQEASTVEHIQVIYEVGDSNHAKETTGNDHGDTSAGTKKPPQSPGSGHGPAYLLHFSSPSSIAEAAEQMLLRKKKEWIERQRMDDDDEDRWGLAGTDLDVRHDDSGVGMGNAAEVGPEAEEVEEVLGAPRSAFDEAIRSISTPDPERRRREQIALTSPERVGPRRLRFDVAGGAGDEIPDVKVNTGSRIDSGVAQTTTRESTGRSVTSELLEMLESVSLDDPECAGRTSGRTSPLNNSVNSPVFFRTSEDLAFTPGYDSCEDLGAETDTTTPGDTVGVSDKKEFKEDTGSYGWFNRMGKILRRTRDDVNALLGCGSPGVAPVSGRSELLQSRPRDFEISFEEIQELDFLGSGATGCVFLGMYKLEKVAVKKFKDRNPTLVETKHMRSLNHENIIALIGVCTTPPVYCIVMEYCPTSLYDEIKNNKIPPRRVCDWARQVACGMEYLHAKQQIHRDLKSPNILLAQDKHTLKISDFGTSRAFGSKSATMSFCGSVSWMAPEMVKGEPCGKKVDVWSFGVVLWELLTGEMPYAGVDQAAIIYGIGNESLHLPVPTTAPLGFSLLLKQCWNPCAKHRPEFRQILLHLQIVQDDDGFLGVPEASYFNTQAQWKAEMIREFAKMKKEEMEIRKMDQSLLKQREEELRHAQDVRQLYEERLWNITSMMKDLKDRERELKGRERIIRKKEKLLGSGKRQYRKRVTGRRRSEDSEGGKRSGPSSRQSSGTSSRQGGVKGVQDTLSSSKSKSERKLEHQVVDKSVVELAVKIAASELVQKSTS